MNAPVILVPGWWLGACAWDEVAGQLRAAGHDVTALTLPGLEPGAERTTVTLSDQVDAICDAVRERPRRACRPQCQRLRGLRRERPAAGPDRGHGLRTTRTSTD